MIPLMNIKNLTNKFSSSSLISSILSTSSIVSTSSNTVKNELKSFSFLQTPITLRTQPVKASSNSLLDQINYIRNEDILSRIKHCDPTMKLNDICEAYVIDNKTNLLIRQSNIEFYSLQHLADVLIDRIIVEGLNRFCLPTEWCLRNLTDRDIRSTHNTIREHGRSFCFLENCQSRLLVFIDSCPKLSNKVK